jgi:hypothetical protein
MFSSFRLLLYSSLPKNCLVRTDPHIVSELARHDGCTPVRILEHAMVALRPNMTPARIIEFSDHIADLDWRNDQLS